VVPAVAPVLPEAKNKGGVTTLQPAGTQTDNDHQLRGSMLKITNVARDKIKELMQEHPEKYLRIIFEGFG
jgi:hypothetical protein